MEKLANISSFENLISSEQQDSMFVFNEIAAGPEKELYDKIDWSKVKGNISFIDEYLTPALKKVWDCYEKGCQGYYVTGDVESKAIELEDAVESLQWAKDCILTFYDSIQPMEQEIRRNLNLAEELLDLISVGLRDDCEDLGVDFEQYI